MMREVVKHANVGVSTPRVRVVGVTAHVHARQSIGYYVQYSGPVNDVQIIIQQHIQPLLECIAELLLFQNVNEGLMVCHNNNITPTM